MSFVLAIACHKFIISFCVCMDMVQAGTRKFIFFSYLSIFSLMSGVGIAIGIIITEAGSGTVPEVVNATLQGNRHNIQVNSKPSKTKPDLDTQ